MLPPGDDERVVDALRAGDRAALAEVYERWSPLVYSIALGTLADVVKAEEVTQRVFTQVWLVRESLDPVRTRFSSWLVDLARGCVEKSAEAESKTAVPTEAFVVADALSHLDTVSQGVLRMALEQSLTAAEIAGRAGLPVGEVRSRLASGLTKLRQRSEVQVHAH